MSEETEKVTIDKVDQVITHLNDALTILDPIKKLINDNIALNEENVRMRTEHAQMREELDHISNQLKKVSSEFEHLQKEKDKKVEVREILALSMTLLTDVFGAAPHSKLLYLLHGFPEGKEIDRKALTQSSGLSPASVRKSLADLNAAKLVDFDVETDKVKLLKKIF
ncbi:MAG: hypothetical protein EAX96_07805 [Candidatus Lokiarchaeota archaeon]|nr:hypothetical protein [Candidatus Lokiarchaeota archaeon]